jgi:hypothetical protein
MAPRLRPTLLASALAGLLAACGSPSGSPSTTAPGSAASGTATAGTPTAGAATESATMSPTAGVTATPAGIVTCTGADLTMVMGGENSASGGQQGMTILLANHSSTTCRLNGSLQATLLDATGNPLPTTQSGAPTGQALLVPQRIALDAVWPQPGEATVLISWHTGDIQPGQCSGSAPQVGEVRLTVPGGGTVTGAAAAIGTMAPCNGTIQLGAITQVTSVPTFASVLDATFQAVSSDLQRTVSTTCTPTPQVGCLTTSSGPTLGSGGSAAYQAFNDYGTGGGGQCFAYVYLDTAGWHPLDVTCVQNGGYNPTQGGANYIFGPGSGCADAHAGPSHGSSVVSCLPWSPTGGGSSYTIDQGPTFTAETDPASGLPDGTVWWHLQSTGWVTQDFLVELPAA